MGLDAHLIELIFTIITSVLASSGFWAFLQRRLDRDTADKRLLVGIAHDRIMFIGGQYLQRGDWITIDEYENLHDYLYVPYVESGGNGAAKKLMDEIDKHLRIVKEPPRENF